MNHTQITNGALNSLIEESKDTLEELSVVSCYNVAIEDKILELGSMPGRVSVQEVESLLGWLQIYSGILGVTVVDLCNFALFDDFSL